MNCLLLSRSIVERLGSLPTKWDCCLHCSKYKRSRSQKSIPEFLLIRYDWTLSMGEFKKAWGVMMLKFRPRAKASSFSLSSEGSVALFEILIILIIDYLVWDSLGPLLLDRVEKVILAWFREKYPEGLIKSKTVTVWLADSLPTIGPLIGRSTYYH